MHHWFHMISRYREPTFLAVVGSRIIFCTRQDSISPAIISFGLRQSIIWTTWNPGGNFPGCPNLPSTVPSSSVLYISPVMSHVPGMFPFGFEFERNAYWWGPGEMHRVQPTPRLVISRMGFRLLS